MTQAEGNAGTSVFTFTVSLASPAGLGGVTFDIATADNTATTASGDYVARALVGQAIAAGESTYTFAVDVIGDASPEPTETFFVNVTNVVGATVSDGQGVGTISNDDVLITQRSQSHGAGAGVAVVGVNQGESPETAAAFLQALSLDFPVALDQRTGVSQTYLVHSLPTTFFIDRGGVIRQIFIGPMSDAVLAGNLRSIYP